MQRITEKSVLVVFLQHRLSLRGHIPVPCLLLINQNGRCFNFALQMVRENDGATFRIATKSASRVTNYSSRKRMRMWSLGAEAGRKVAVAP